MAQARTRTGGRLRISPFSRPHQGDRGRQDPSKLPPRIRIRPHGLLGCARTDELGGSDNRWDGRTLTRPRKSREK